MRSPPAFSAPTRSPENWGHHVVPSELLTNTVEMPCARAWATMACGSAPLDLATYQIHIPLPSNGVAEAVFGGAGLTTRSGRTEFERRPARSRTYKTPATALA